MLRTRLRAGPVAGFVVSVLFALVVTGISVADLYLPSLVPRMGSPAPFTLRLPYGPRIVRDTQHRLVYEHTRLIVPRGTVLHEWDDNHRAAFAYESIRRPPTTGRLGSLYVLYFIIGMMLTAYLRRFGQSRVHLLRAQVGLLGLMAGSLVFAKALLLFTALPEFWIPVAALPLWVALAFDRRTAFLVEVGGAFIAASLLRFDLILLCVLLVRGIASTLFFLDRKHPRQMLIAGALAGVAGAIGMVALTVIFEGRFSIGADLARGLSSNVLACVGGGVLAGLLARALREPAERVMGHVSRDKLLDLTDLEHPLLKKMAAEAPGSWEHARTMANLAEAAAAAIGADALLTRVGAYYHDLGKTVQSKYFIENLGPGERSPHEDLDPDVSADAIMAHVVMGTKILRDGHIPEPVVEFAYTHHGTQMVEFFWHKCKEQGNPKGLTEEHFRYPGMKPQTKETAILMLVDSIEAASRTVWPPEQKKFEEMIQRVVFHKLAGGQLDESGLTLQDLRILSSRMASTLVNMSHGRIKYPWQREAERARATQAQSVATPLPAVTPSPKAVDAPSAEPTESSRLSQSEVAEPPVSRRSAPKPADTGSPAPESGSRKQDR
ncbi:HDIG domain-containing metalloprotein [Chondromyces crocatus]|uniref:HDIG domain-containing protein n=1 Tax=Chondromyces crocatus TaxID=52 RepID=A0A0K1E621_CHOCO|nr:HDIG domain-containing metalloprotein [Chondromyces crocatus]AKT36299.1 HDIG domain-containing protein [Chondromyces crocatus]